MQPSLHWGGEHIGGVPSTWSGHPVESSEAGALVDAQLAALQKFGILDQLVWN